jgi:hypothetical protein
MARPTLYSEPIIDEIVERLSGGEPLAQICRDEHMPCKATVNKWQLSDDGINSRITHARDEGFDALAEQCLEISDDERHDWKMTKKGIVTDEVAIGRARLQVDTRLKLLSKWNPKKYGDKIDMTTGGEPLTDAKTVDAKLAFLLGKAGVDCIAGSERADKEPE